MDFRLNKVFSCQKHLDQVPMIYAQDNLGTIKFAKANTRFTSPQRMLCVTPSAGPQRREAAELWASPGSPGGFSSTMCLCPMGKGRLMAEPFEGGREARLAAPTKTNKTPLPACYCFLANCISITFESWNVPWLAYRCCQHLGKARETWCNTTS